MVLPKDEISTFFRPIFTRFKYWRGYTIVIHDNSFEESSCFALTSSLCDGIGHLWRYDILKPCWDRAKSHTEHMYLYKMSMVNSACYSHPRSLFSILSLLKTLQITRLHVAKRFTKVRLFLTLTTALRPLTLTFWRIFCHADTFTPAQRIAFAKDIADYYVDKGLPMFYGNDFFIPLEPDQCFVAYHVLGSSRAIPWQE